MKLKTRVFGEIDIDDEKIITFENGIIGFPDLKRFTLIFNEEKKAVDWIFRYGNEALAVLEKLPLNKMIGRSFSSLFLNMDAKWLRGYERATLYGETLEIVDYSPEIGKNLKIICFPTFPGHCGCILFDTDKLRYIREGNQLAKSVVVFMKTNSME